MRRVQIKKLQSDIWYTSEPANCRSIYSPGRDRQSPKHVSPEFSNHDAIILGPRCEAVIFKQNGREIPEETEKDWLWLPEKKKYLGMKSYRP